ncbi:UDP-N-acetylmuramoyl-L-alanyl-D-glutamate--2,6-diaminopimelate ligase [Thermovibrio sp.]
MELSYLLKPFFPTSRIPSAPVRGITEDSREVSRGFLFFAYKGFSTDGNLFVKEAVEKGAVAVITDSERTYGLYKGKLPVFKTDRPRELSALVSARFYGNPERELTLIGITGTNGKTTTAFLTYGALTNLGEKGAYLGTLGYCLLGGPLTPLGMTTPPPTKLFKLLKSFVKKGVSFVSMEVSSHALELSRVYGINFKASAFTNLTPEHLDFHKDLYSYFLSKEKLFFQSENSLFNLDDRWGRTLFALRGALSTNSFSYGSLEGSDFKIVSFKNGLLNLLYKGELYRIKSSLKGSFNGYNLAVSFALLVLCGLNPSELVNSYLGLKVPGRFEEVAEGVFVDYAHTPDALLKVLKALRPLKRGRLITVFGCGGDRDEKKRPLMGAVAKELSDLVIITNDNPRTEEPEKIVSDILSGIKDRDKVVVILDRKEAIEKALSLKGEGDIVLIAGKGHEDYQIIGNRKLPFKDQEVVKEFYGRLKGSRGS